MARLEKLGRAGPNQPFPWLSREVRVLTCEEVNNRLCLFGVGHL